MRQPAPLPPLDSPNLRVSQLAAAVRDGRPLPPPAADVLQAFVATAEGAVGGDGDWGSVAEVVVAAELVDRGFRYHRLREDGVCRRDELLLGDYSLVCAAELVSQVDRSDVEEEFARAAMIAALGDDYHPRLHAAVGQAVTGAPRQTPPRARAAPPMFTEVGAELELIEAEIRRLVGEDPDSVGAPMAEMLEAGGKRLRPQLAFLASTLGPDHDPVRAATLAAVVEFIHNATLVHDDLVDQSPLRRGQPAVHVARGPGTAVRVGDYYFGRAASLLARLDRRRATRLIVEAVSRVCQAQIEEFRSRGIDHLDERGYLEIVEGKTAALFAGACAAGAAVGGADGRVIQAMAGYGHNLGIAFQIVDDVLDFSPNSGKTLVQDLRQSVGLPLVYASEDGAVRDSLVALLADEEGFDAEAAVAIVTRAGALGRSIERARDYRDQALLALEAVPEGDTSSRLAAIAAFAIERQA